MDSATLPGPSKNTSTRSGYKAPGSTFHRPWPWWFPTLSDAWTNDTRDLLSALHCLTLTYVSSESCSKWTCICKCSIYQTNINPKNPTKKEMKETIIYNHDMKETTIKSIESWATPNKFSHDLLVLPSCWLLRHSVSKSAVSPETNTRRHQLWHGNQLKPTKCMRFNED